MRALLLALAGCLESPRVSVHLDFVQPGVPASILEYARSAGTAWESVGVGYTDTPGPSDIVIQVIFSPSSELGGAAGLTNTTTHQTSIATELTGLALTSVMAHEIGHSVFNSPDHLAPGLQGIMSAVSQGYTTPTYADLDYAGDRM